jgi:hypothetical protein
MDKTRLGWSSGPIKTMRSIRRAAEVSAKAMPAGVTWVASEVLPEASAETDWRRLRFPSFAGRRVMRRREKAPCS